MNTFADAQEWLRWQLGPSSSPIFLFTIGIAERRQNPAGKGCPFGNKGKLGLLTTCAEVLCFALLFAFGFFVHSFDILKTNVEAPDDHLISAKKTVYSPLQPNSKF